MRIKTIEDLEKLYYSPEGAEFIQKADAPVKTSTTGVYNAVYGAFAWAWLNQEANAFGILPKYPWARSGWRVITARAGVGSGATGTYGGVAEGGTLPETTKPTFAEVSTKPKQMTLTFESSSIQDYIVNETNDDAYGGMEQMRTIMAIQHKENINKALLADVSAAAAAASADYSGTDDFETLDRIISNDSEEDAFGGTYNAFFDIYGLDRDTATTNDAVVSHNSGTDRELTDDLLRDLLADVREAGGKDPTVLLTGHDTYAKIQGLYSTFIRYNQVGEANVEVGVNGIQTTKGAPIGLHVPTLYGIPLIVSKDVTKDTISRIYALDTSDPEGFGVPRLGVMIAKPTMYFEARDPFVVEKLSYKGMFVTTGEVVCRHFPSQGKMRDLK